MGTFEHRVSDGLKTVIRKARTLPLGALFFATVWPAYSVWVYYTTGGWFWQFIAGAAAVWLVGVIDLIGELRHAQTSIEYPGRFRHGGQDYVVAQIVRSTDGTITVQAVTKKIWITTHSEFRAGGPVA